ncbi:hypothetical protein AVEN_16472-1 [Araneus ventricosus]|uniref:Uncharacterized protein n=1 Tax=Araneus ventricosus TaxID=182803 RepID=A0A4Y2UED2_ARAVE|nr:hypothetical protein AVEN_16472-1 [Araneus ventricosus]
MQCRTFRHSFIFPCFLQLFPQTSSSQPTAKGGNNTRKPQQTVSSCGGIHVTNIHLSGVSKEHRNTMQRIIFVTLSFSCFLQLFPKLAALSQPLKEEITHQKSSPRQFLQCGILIYFPRLAALSQPQDEITPRKAQQQQKITCASSSDLDGLYKNQYPFKWRFKKEHRNNENHFVTLSFSLFLQLFPKLAALSQPLKEEITQKGSIDSPSSVVEFSCAEISFN